MAENKFSTAYTIFQQNMRALSLFVISSEVQLVYLKKNEKKSYIKYTHTHIHRNQCRQSHKRCCRVVVYYYTELLIYIYTFAFVCMHDRRRDDTHGSNNNNTRNMKYIKDVTREYRLMLSATLYGEYLQRHVSMRRHSNRHCCDT